jgi:hypothetical protein
LFDLWIEIERFYQLPVETNDDVRTRWLKFREIQFAFYEFKNVSQSTRLAATTAAATAAAGDAGPGNVEDSLNDRLGHSRLDANLTELRE